jgi:hypothetical protein
MSPKKRKRDWATDHVDPQALADALVARLAPAIAAGWSLIAGLASVDLTAPDGRSYGFSTDLRSGWGTNERRLLGLVGDMLNICQSEIAEATTEPWPARSDEHYGDFPEPWVGIVGDALHMRYGDGPSLALELEPINLREIFGSGV